MKQQQVDVYMIGPGASENVSGGVVTVMESLIDMMNERFIVHKIVTMRPTGFLERLKIYIKAIVSIIAVSNNNDKQKIAHVHMASRTSFYRKSIIILLLKLFKNPIILHIHGGEFHLFYESSNKLMQKYMRLIFSLTDRTILLADSWQQWYIKTINMNESNVIYNGVKDYYDKNSLSLNNREDIILFLGKLGEQKGIYDLLYSFKEVLKIVPNAILKIGGNGEVEKAKDLAEDLKISQSIEFLGWVNEIDKFKLLNKSKIYILPSYNEGLPMGLLEAMSAGIGLVSTDVGGIPEALKDKMNGLLVKAGNRNEISNALITMLRDENLLEKLGKEARKSFMKKFNSKTMTKQVEVIYDEVL